MELVNRIVPPKPSSEEIQKGKPKREAFRNKLLQTQKVLVTLKNGVSTPLGLTIDQKALETLVDTNLAWVNVNIEVRAEDIDVKQTSYDESFDTLVQRYNANAIKAFEANPSQEIVNEYPFMEGKKELQQQLQRIQQKDKTNKQQEREKLQNRTFWDDFLDAFKSVFKWGIIFFLVVYGLRSASFAANQNLWRPLPYRVIIFIYTFIFFPIWIPYYLYREIKHLIWPCIDEPHFESVFPVTPYNPGDGMDLNKRLFGYPNVPDLCAWLLKKKEEWKESQYKAICHDFHKKIMVEYEESFAKTA
jgi:hypothetical protein